MSDTSPPSLDNTLVWVQTWWKRDGVIDRVCRSIEASDIGARYEVVRQPESCEVGREFFVQTLERVASSSHQWTLWLQDDVVVNRHIMHNLGAWKAVSDPLFGAGWLSYPSSVLRDGARLGSTPRGLYRNCQGMHFAGGVLLPTANLHKMLSLPFRVPGKMQVDLLVSHAVWGIGKRVFFHRPALVKMDFSIPSSIGHVHRDTAQPYEENWRAK